MIEASSRTCFGISSNTHCHLKKRIGGQLEEILKQVQDDADDASIKIPAA